MFCFLGRTIFVVNSVLMNDEKTTFCVKWKHRKSIPLHFKKCNRWLLIYIKFQDEQPGQQIMVSSWKARNAFQLSLFGTLMDLTLLGDHESVTGLVSTQICGIIYVGCYPFFPANFFSHCHHYYDFLSAVTPRKKTSTHFEFHTAW